MFNQTNSPKSKLTRLLAFAAIFMMIFTSAVVFDLTEVNAAKENLTITSLKWSKKSVDTTLKPQTVSLTVKAKNTYKKATKLKVVIQNTKTKNSLTTYAKKNGGKVSFAFSNDKSDIGTWKVVSVSAIYQVKKHGTKPGYWDGFGNYHQAVATVTTIDKNLKTVKPSKKTKTFKVACGVRPKFSLNAPTTVIASDTQTSVSAILKTDKGKAIVGESIEFKVALGNYGTVTWKGTAKTNAQGVATVNITLPSDERFDVTASYKGKAKKYCAVSVKKNIYKVKENTKFASGPSWDGHTGRKTFQVQLVVNGGKNNGKPIAQAGIPVDWYFYDKATGNVRLTFISKESVTDANGIARLTADIKEWLNYGVVVRVNTAVNSTKYNPPNEAEYSITRKETIRYYTLDPSKLSLTGGASYYPDWFEVSTTSSAKRSPTIEGAPNIFIDENGKPLPPLETCVAISIKPTTYKIDKLAPNTVLSIDSGNATFKDSYHDEDIVETIGTMPVEHLNATSLKVTFTLGEFGSDKYNPEFRYIPINGKSTIEKVFTKK